MVNTYTFHYPPVRVCSSLPVSFSLCCLPVGIWMWPWVDNHCLLSQSMVTALRSAAFLFLWVFPYFFCPRSFLVLCPQAEQEFFHCVMMISYSNPLNIWISGLLPISAFSFPSCKNKAGRLSKEDKNECKWECRKPFTRFLITLPVHGNAVW